jgi:hypothetical protein
MRKTLIYGAGDVVSRVGAPQYAIEPSRVLDRTIDLADVPDGYRAMADREALKVLIHP